MTTKDLFRFYIYPIATMAGSIIGVGFLSLPFITLKVGTWFMLFYFIALAALIIFLHVIVAEITLKTPDFKRFAGFADFYLGSWARNLSLVLNIFGAVGVLLAYLIIGSEFLMAIFEPFWGKPQVFYVTLYCLVLSSIVYFGAKALSRIEFWAIILLLASMLLIFFRGFAQISLTNLFQPGMESGLMRFFLPYGPIVFSLWGTGLIPEVEEMLRHGHKHLLKRIIIISTIIPAVIYLAFILLVLGITGEGTTESALIGIKNQFGNGVAMFTLLIGLITTFTAFIAQGSLLKETFIYDMKMKNTLAWLLACFVPLLLYFMGLNSFFGLISFVGGVFLGISGIMILMMYKKIGGKKYVIYPLSLVFILGMMYELIFFIL